MKTIRWGLIGCGKVAEVKSGPAYQQTEGFELAAVMRRDLDKARDFAHRHGVAKAYGSADALIGDDDIDAVYIATPPDSHERYALAVAAAGKICCIEKPMAPTHGACVRMCEAFERAGRPLFVAYYRRTLPRFEQVRHWLADGAIGELRHVHWQLTRPASNWDLTGHPHWRTDPQVAPGGYFDDLASHGLDLLIYLVGDIERASGCALNQQGLYQVPDAVTAHWRHRSGVTGSGSWHFGAARRDDRVEITGSQGEIIFSVFADVPLRLRNAGGEHTLRIENPDPIQGDHVAAMYRQLAGSGAHPSTGRSAAHTTWVMEEILGGD